MFKKDIQYYKFCFYGFFKNLRFFDAFILLFFLSKGLDYWQIGVIFSVREITRNVLEIPSGFIADSLGRRTSLSLSFVLYIASYLSFYLSNSFSFILIAMFFYAIGDAFRTDTHKSMIYNYLEINGWKEYKAAYYGNTRSWSQFGSAICSIVGAVFVWYSGSYATVFLFSIIPAFLDMLLILSYPKSLEGSLKEKHKKNTSAAIKESWKQIKEQVKLLSFWRNINLVSLHSGYYRAIKDYLQPILATAALGISVFTDNSDIQREAAIIGIAYFLIYLISSMASRNAGRLAKHISQPNKAMFLTLISGLASGAVGGTLIILGLEWWGILALVLIFPIENIRKPIGLAKVSDEGRSDIQAFILSIESQAGSLYTALLAPIIGVLADHHSPGFGIAVCSGGLIALTLFLHIWGKINNRNTH